MTADRLLAALRLPAGAVVTSGDLDRLCAAAGVGHGRLTLAVGTSLGPEAADCTFIVARGLPAEPPQPVRFVPAIDLASLPMLVRVGTVLGRMAPARAGRPGRGVDGLEIAPSAAAETASGPRAGAGLATAADGLVTADRDGMLRLSADGGLSIALVGAAACERPSILVRIDMHARQAWITLRAGEFVSPATLQAGLQRANVTHGIRAEAVAEAGRASAETRQLMVAEGEPPVAGQPARIDHLAPALVLPSLDLAEEVDFAELARQGRVEAGTPLLRVVPSTPSRPGADIFGRRVAGRPGRPIDPEGLAGPGTRVCPDDGLLVRADTAGRIGRAPGGQVSVQPSLVIDGDLDADLDTEQPVEVHGDILDGVQVRCDGDIIVHGSIRDAAVSSQGHLLVRGGISAPSGTVCAARSVYAGSVHGGLVTGAVIVVQGTALGCTLHAQEQLTVADLAGSVAVAGRGIAVGGIRASAVQASQVEIGTAPRAAAADAHATERLAALERQGVELKQRCVRMAQEMRDRALEAEARHLPAELRRMVAEYGMIMSQVSAARSRLPVGQVRTAAAPVPTTARIAVRGLAEAGTLVAFGSLVHVLAEPLRGRLFAVRDGRIAW